MLYSGPPTAPVPVPPRIAALAGGRPLVPVWENESGGLTFRIGEGEETLFAKWAAAGSGPDLAAEAERLVWAAPFTPVPRVLEHGSDADGSWLVTAGLPGENAVSPRWRADPGGAVRALGEGLRALHDQLPAAGCPFSWSVPDRVERARREGVDVPDGLLQPPPVERLVVCHGDACAPNTLLADDGSWSAHVDLGSLGLADRWADLAVASANTVGNYGPGWEDALLEAYGVTPDRQRLAYYRSLWRAT
ncbi:phosphotransferase [Streptomyces sp. NPDC008150]|uniref:phosphotransferase n=1 Tax=Streptomyces sp. NPDC008150 TaxID=3364816 RepID=UPI0036F04384